MTGTSALESSETIESRAPQHWSREEWFYMWTRGLDPWRIAVLCRVPYRKVYDHIRTKIIYKPELFGQRLMLHDQPAWPPGGPRKKKIPWEERAAQVVHFRSSNGRFPRGYVDGESTLYSFLQHQRGQHRAGKLSDSKREYLDEHLPGWLTPPKAEREHALWEQRVTEMESFVREQGRYPRYKTGPEPLEKVLAVWMERQRHCLRVGLLDGMREQRLNERVPGWKDVMGPKGRMGRPPIPDRTTN